MPRRLIIDTNLLLLLVIGAVEGQRHIRNSSRLNAYTDSDYFNVLRIMGEYDEVYITPYIAAEVSNLIDLDGHARLLAFEIAQEFFGKLFKKVEIDIEKDCESSYFLNFGIADSSLIRLATEYSILTADLRLLIPLFDASPNTIVPYYSLNGSF